MNGTLVAVAVLFPIVAGLICLLIENHRARAGIVYLTAAVLIINSIFFLRQVSFPIEYSPAPGWDWVILVFSYAILAYFIFAAVRDIIQRGASRHNILTIALTLAAGIPLAIFEFSWAPHEFLERSPVFYICHFSILRGLIVSVICPLICIYAIRYMKVHEEHRMRLGELKVTNQPRFFFYMLVLIGAMNGVAFSDNLLWLAFFWELTTLCGYALVRHDQTPEAITCGFRLLWMCLIGGVCFTLAIILSWYSPLNTISLTTLVANGAVSHPALLLPFALLCLAGFTKAAQVPFHRWGVEAALVAPAPVHAMLYPFMTTGAFLVLYLAPGFPGTQLAIFLAVYGAASALALALMAISQRGGISVLVCSAISNLAFIILCAGIGTPSAMAAGVMLIIFLTISMVLLYLCVGAIEHHIWNSGIEDMEGLARKQPLLTGITIAAMLSLLVAPFGILISKWAAIQAASDIGIWSTLVLVLLMLSIGAVTVFWAKWIGRLLCQSPTPGSARLEPFIAHYHGILLILLGFAVLTSLLVAPMYNTLIAPIIVDAGYDAALAFTTETWFLRAPGGIFAGWPVFIVVAIVLLIPLIAMKAKPEASRAAYMCGENVEIGSDEFVAVADERTELKTGGLYIESLLGEQKLDRFVVPAGVILLVILFLLVAI